MRIVIPGKPIQQQRPRFRVNSHRNPQLYDPCSRDKTAVKLAIMPQIPENLSSPPLHNLANLRIECYFPLLKRNINNKNLECWGVIHKHSKPDLDNLAKFYLDCGNGLLWKDDAEIHSLKVTKHYSRNPRTEMIFEYEQPPADPAKKILRHLNPEQLQEFLDYAFQLMELTEDGYENLSNENLDKAAALIGIMSTSSEPWIKKVSKEVEKISNQQ